jgi:hypothetical protein
MCYSCDMRFAAPILLLGFLVAACSNPTVDECERLCRKYSELAYFEKVEAAVTSMPADDAARVRSEKKEAWEAMQEDEAHLKKLDNCMTGCRRGTKKPAIACVDRAETVAEADACMKK